MTLHAANFRKVRDGRNHPAETFRDFQALLNSAETIDVQPDPKRNDFFELYRAPRVFYFYLSPVSGDILLLAVWKNKNSRKTINAAEGIVKNLLTDPPAADPMQADFILPRPPLRRLFES